MISQFWVEIEDLTALGDFVDNGPMNCEGRRRTGLVEEFTKLSLAWKTKIGLLQLFPNMLDKLPNAPLQPSAWRQLPVAPCEDPSYWIWYLEADQNLLILHSFQICEGTKLVGFQKCIERQNDWRYIFETIWSSGSSSALGASARLAPVILHMTTTTSSILRFSHLFYYYPTIEPHSYQLIMDTTPAEASPPSVIRYVLGFLLIGLAWGFTTPFIRAAARTHKPPPHPILDSSSVKNSWLKGKLYGAFFGVVDLLKNPKYAIPLVINLTGSIWFFLLIGKAGKFSLPSRISSLDLDP